MSIEIDTDIIWDVPCSEENVVKVLSAVQAASDQQYRSASQFAVLKGSRYEPLNVESVRKLIKRGLFDENKEALFKENQNNWEFPGIDFFGWDAVLMYFFFSPLSGSPIRLWLITMKDQELTGYGKILLRFSLQSAGILWEGLPIDEEAEIFKSGVLPDDYCEMDTFWEEHYEPAWPKNAAILMEIVDSVKDLFPLISVEIPPEVTEPEKHCDMELSEVLQLTNQPPEGFDSA